MGLLESYYEKRRELCASWTEKSFSGGPFVDIKNTKSAWWEDAKQIWSDGGDGQQELSIVAGRIYRKYGGWSLKYALITKTDDGYVTSVVELKNGKAKEIEVDSES